MEPQMQQAWHTIGVLIVVISQTLMDQQSNCTAMQM
jgi:hypothetical protein